MLRSLQVTRLWLISFFFGWFQKLLFNEPQMILIKHVILPLVFIGSLERRMSSTR